MLVRDFFEGRPEEAEWVFSGKTVFLNTEHSLGLYEGNVLLHSFVCSPSQLGVLCAGWLTGQGYCARSVEVAQDGLTATVQGLSAKPEAPGCTQEVSATKAEMLALFKAASDKYARSHGVHECVIKGDGWHILRTDIGRHNAMDKAIGAAVLAGYDLRGTVMFTSGRINLQTVEKATCCGIATLMSKATVTQEALQLAKERNLKVFFSVKED